jgi:hypothetical protein
MPYWYITGHEHKRAQKLYNHNSDIQDLCSVTNLHIVWASFSLASYCPYSKTVEQKRQMRQTRIERVTFRLPRILDRTELLQSDALPTELLALVL